MNTTQTVLISKHNATHFTTVVVTNVLSFVFQVVTKTGNLGLIMLV